MSQGISCKEPSHKPSHKPQWFVIQRNQRCSAFDGYKVCWSPYSCVRCGVCGTAWRTKAAFVDALPNAPADWATRPTGEHFKVYEEIAEVTPEQIGKLLKGIR